MSIHIKIAETTEEIDGLLRARHRVYVEEEGYMAACPDGRILDRFDAYHATANFIVVADGLVVGGVRYVEATGAGTPADDYFDFSPHLPAGGVKIGSGSLVFVERAYRQIPNLTFTLMGMGFYWVASRRLTHVLGVANPEVEGFFLKAGFRRLAPQMYDEQNELPFVLILLDLNELSEKFSAFVRDQKSNECWLPRATLQAAMGL